MYIPGRRARRKSARSAIADSTRVLCYTVSLCHCYCHCVTVTVSLSLCHCVTVTAGRMYLPEGGQGGRARGAPWWIAHGCCAMVFPQSVALLPTRPVLLSLSARCLALCPQSCPLSLPTSAFASRLSHPPACLPACLPAFSLLSNATAVLSHVVPQGQGGLCRCGGRGALHSGHRAQGTGHSAQASQARPYFSIRTAPSRETERAREAVASAHLLMRIAPVSLSPPLLQCRGTRKCVQYSSPCWS